MNLLVGDEQRDGFRNGFDIAFRGERTAFYQPAVELPQPFARQEFSLNDVTNISPQSHAFILDKIANASFGWFQPLEEDFLGQGLRPILPGHSQSLFASAKLSIARHNN